MDDGRVAGPPHIVYLLYWYKNTCFTGTRILALDYRLGPHSRDG
jgi:hypothetical protein